MKTLSITGRDIDFKVTDKLESVVQRVTQRLLFFQGEYFINGSLGIPYLQQILGHGINESLILQIITQQISTVQDVQDVQNPRIAISKISRKITYSAEILTAFGPAAINESISI